MLFLVFCFFRRTGIHSAPNWCAQWPNGHVNNMCVCWWEHLSVCVETVCHISLVHVDHFAGCLPRLHLPSDKYYRHTLLTDLFTVDNSTLCDRTSLFSSPFAPVRFRAVVADVIARAPEVFLQEALCLPRVCDRSRGDGWHNGVYLRSHSLTLASVWQA